MNDVKINPNEKIADDLYTNEDSIGYLMAHEIMAAGNKPAIQSPALAPGLKKIFKRKKKTKKYHFLPKSHIVIFYSI